MSSDRFEPHASRAMASMFDDVSGRYDFLNRVMTLGQDGAWREAMWRAVPEDARVVLDLCTGSGVSLAGLRRPGRLVLGIDVSVAMLEVARDSLGTSGWAPRLACADAFHLPLRDGALDAVTIAFGIRNLRPQAAALRELARVLRPGGTLSVLEAAAPGRGAFAPLHAFWVRRVIPLAGRLSPDPSAYRYLSESIFEFGAGPEFEAGLARAGFHVEASRSFLLGAARHWSTRRLPAGQKPAEPGEVVQFARGASGGNPQPGREALANLAERRVWRIVQAALSAVLTVMLAWALVAWANLNVQPPLTPLQRTLGWTLLASGTIFFAVRSAWLAMRVWSEASRR